MCSYDDHKIKVQLRDNHPNGRRSQWNYRGRGRFNQGRGYLSHEVDQSSGNTEDTPSTPKPLVTPTNQSPSKEMTLSADIVLKYPCITDPLSEENERALRHALDSGEDGTSPRAPSPGTTVDSLSPLTSLCLKSPEGPPRADSVRRSTQSEPDVQSPSSLNNTDVLSTYAPSSAGSAPASSNYHSHDNHCITNPWTPSLYPICTPVSQEYSHTRATVPAAQAVAPDGTFPWMGVYRARIFLLNSDAYILKFILFFFLEYDASCAVVQPSSRSGTDICAPSSDRVYSARWYFYPCLSSGEARPVYVYKF